MKKLHILLFLAIMKNVWCQGVFSYKRFSPSNDHLFSELGCLYFFLYQSSLHVFRKKIVFETQNHNFFPFCSAHFTQISYSSSAN